MASKKGNKRMFCADVIRKCQVVKKITDQDIVRCLKPSNVILVLNTPTPDGDPLIMCLDCARKLAKEILDSVPSGKGDIARQTKRSARRG